MARGPGTLRPGAWPSSEVLPASFSEVVPWARLSPLTTCGQQEAGLPAALALEPVPPAVPSSSTDGHGDGRPECLVSLS